MHVDGEFDGGISGAAMVSVGVQGVVRGVIRARRVIVSGRVHGDLHCSLLELMRQAQVEGDVHCEQLTVEKGGLLEGRCTRVSYEDGVACEPVALPAPGEEPARA
ncbi:MAG: polymer-forming cytoskeletal protein [Pseudomonadota bacterium]